MKLKTTLKTMAAVFAVALCQLAQAATDNVPGVSAQPDSYFYTGKPYDADLGGYTFAYRNYDPHINRWTSADPSGFPDGANSHMYVSNHCDSLLDTNGLREITINVTWTLPVIWNEDRWQPPVEESLKWSWSSIAFGAQQGSSLTFDLTMHAGQDVAAIYGQAMLTMGGGPNRVVPDGMSQQELAQYHYKVGSAENLTDAIISKSLSHSTGQQSTQPGSTLDQWSGTDNHKLTWIETWIE